MSILAPIALIGWIPFILAVFCFYRPRTAVLISLFGAWMFLPMAGISIPGFPDYGKISAGPVAAMLGVLLFDADRLRRIRWSLWDLPLFVVIASPMVSSINAGYGSYDGVATVVNVLITCGIAYILGRAYFSDAEGRRSLAMAFFIAGLIYVPFCLFEMRLSPQLHHFVYGFTQHEFAQTRRMGGWRPMVFMQHGLAVGLFMSAAAAVGVWLWMTRQCKSVMGLPIGLAVLVLLITAILCKSAFAIALLAVALAMMGLVRGTRLTVPLVLLALLPPAYMVGRITGYIQSSTLIEMAEPVAGKRIGSLETRIASEDVLIPLAMKHPLWGVSRWASLIQDRQGNRTDTDDFDVKVIPDALWIITLATRGLVGLGALVLVFFVPVLALVHLRQKNRNAPVLAAFDPATALALVLIMHMADNVLNAMVSPVYWLIAGGLTGILSTRATVHRPVRSTPIIQGQRHLGSH